VDSLPKGVRLWVIMDCCHSGTALDLNFKITMGSDGSMSCSKKRQGQRGARKRAEVIMISGCKDTQTSADIGAGTAGVAKAAGAMTTAFRHTINPNVSCAKLLVNMRIFLKRNNFDQVPQMSSDNSVQLDAPFVNYQEKKRGKRELPASLMASMGGGAPLSPQQQPMAYSSPMAMGAPVSPQQDPALDNRLRQLEAEINALRVQGLASPQGTMMPGSPMMMGSPQPMSQYGMAPGGMAPMGGMQGIQGQMGAPPSWGGGGGGY